MESRIIQIVFVAIMLIGGAAQADESADSGRKAAFALSQIMIDKQAPISRSEVWAWDMFLNSDLYVVTQSQNKHDMYKVRLQALPLATTHIAAGVVVQHLGVTGIAPSDMTGMVVRLQGKPCVGCFVKADTRYFPSKKFADGYIVGGSRHMFIDLLWQYDTNTEKGLLRPGVDYRFTRNVSLGLEGGYVGKFSSLTRSYAGIRLKVRF